MRHRTHCQIADRHVVEQNDVRARLERPPHLLDAIALHLDLHPARRCTSRSGALLADSAQPFGVVNR